MAKILVNDKQMVHGHMSITREKDIDKDGNIILRTEGIFQCNIYFEEITTLEIPRFKILGVDVQRESFGSDDYLMSYEFICEDIDFNGIYSKDIEAYTYLSPNEMKAVEDIMFKDDCPILGGIGKEYLNIIGKKDEEEGESNE